MKKRCLAFLLALCMVMTLLPTTAWAADSDFIIKDGVLVDYKGSGGDVIIPDGVTSIGYGAFLSCDKLLHVIIPNSVTSIGQNAFWNCTALKEIIIPNSVISIGPQAFCDCSSVTNLYLGESLITIERFAFAHLDSLETITYHAKNATDIEYTAFSVSNGTGIDVTFGEAVEIIPAYLFYGSPGPLVESAIIGKNVKKIKEGAFEGSGLTSIEIPNSVSEIGENAFSNCQKLKYVRLGEGISTIGLDAFCSCSALEKIEFDAISMQNVENYIDGREESSVFRESGTDNGLTIVVSDSVERIPAHIFRALNIKDLKLGNNVKSIGYGAFASTTLKYVEIPGSVTTIEGYAFGRCSQLNSVSIGKA